MTNHPHRSKGPMFGRRHWDAMSSMMRRNYIGSDLRQWTRIRNDTATMFAEDNEAFDRAKFVEACSPAKVNCPQCRGIGYFGHPHDGMYCRACKGSGVQA